MYLKCCSHGNQEVRCRTGHCRHNGAATRVKRLDEERPDHSVAEEHQADENQRQQPSVQHLKTNQKGIETNTTFLIF